VFFFAIILFHINKSYIINWFIACASEISNRKWKCLISNRIICCKRVILFAFIWQSCIPKRIIYLWKFGNLCELQQFSDDEKSILEFINWPLMDLILFKVMDINNKFLFLKISIIISLLFINKFRSKIHSPVALFSCYIYLTQLQSHTLKQAFNFLLMI